MATVRLKQLKYSLFIKKLGFSEVVAMLSSVPARLIVRRSRSMLPGTHIFQTNVNALTCQSIREIQVDFRHKTVKSTFRVSKRGILDDKTDVNSVVQYHYLAPKWLSNLDNRRPFWAALAIRGNNKNQYWEENHETGWPGLASVSLLSAAAFVLCLNNDSDQKGTQSLSCYCLICYSKKNNQNKQKQNNNNNKKPSNAYIVDVVHNRLSYY